MGSYLVESQFNDLREVHNHPKLFVSDKENYSHFITGILAFEYSNNKYPIRDAFEVFIAIPDNYPYLLPKVIESGKRIPRINKHHINPDGTCCLASRRQQMELYSKYPSLLGFAEKLIIPFLYSFCCYSKYGIRPFGELSHGSLGLLEDYKRSFNLGSKKEVCELILHLIDLHKRPRERFNVRTRSKCPCGSKKRFNECHLKYYEVINYYSEKDLLADYEEISKLN